MEDYLMAGALGFFGAFIALIYMRLGKIMDLLEVKKEVN